MSEVCEDCMCFVKLVAEFWAAGKDENDVLVSLKEAAGIEEWYGSVVVIFNIRDLELPTSKYMLFPAGHF
jgi:hypothetical protein